MNKPSFAAFTPEANTTTAKKKYYLVVDTTTDLVDLRGICESEKDAELLVESRKKRIREFHQYYEGHELNISIVAAELSKLSWEEALQWLKENFINWSHDVDDDDAGL